MKLAFQQTHKSGLNRFNLMKNIPSGHKCLTHSKHVNLPTFHISVVETRTQNNFLVSALFADSAIVFLQGMAPLWISKRLTISLMW